MDDASNSPPDPVQVPRSNSTPSRPRYANQGILRIGSGNYESRVGLLDVTAPRLSISQVK